MDDLYQYGRVQSRPVAADAFEHNSLAGNTQMVVRIVIECIGYHRWIARVLSYDFTGVIPASLSFAISSSTLSTCEDACVNDVNQSDKEGRRTLPPPCRLGGSVTFTVSRMGVRSTLRSAGVSFSMGFFFAFMMLGSEE